MTSSLLAQLAHVTQGHWHHLSDGMSYPSQGITIDSRRLQSGEIFWALAGEQFDGHQFIASSYQKGALFCVGHAPVATLNLPATAVYLQVPDSLLALQQWATWWRSQQSCRVIAVTGSNGKTTVKEMLAAMFRHALGPDAVTATSGNLNNHIGVPLTLLRIKPTHQVAIVELGMNHVGEMAQLAAWTQPDIALVNNAQREHQEFLKDVATSAFENGQVCSALRPNGVAIYPQQSEYVPIWQQLAHGQRQITFAVQGGATSDVSAQIEQQSAVALRATVTGLSRIPQGLNLALGGQHALHNALAAATCGLAYGLEAVTICAGLATFQPVAGRMTQQTMSVPMTTGLQSWCVIDDSYNANPDSVRAAIEVLQIATATRVLVLGDMGEVGAAGAAFHHEVGAYAKACGIDYLLTLGDLARVSSDAFGAGSQHCTSVDELLAAFLTLQPVDGGTLLIKGSRFMKMERVLHALLAKAQPQAENISC